MLTLFKQNFSNPFMSHRLKAWLVHIFTATGIGTVFMALVETAANDFRAAMLWLLAAQLIDGLDGTLARRYQVEKYLPNISGKRMDLVIDFAGYCLVPAYMIYQAPLMSDLTGLMMALLILISSAIYYGKSGMISEDYYFVGFPVMWNLTAFYLIFIFDLPELFNAGLIVLLALMQFLPVKFAYPSRTPRWMPANITFSVLLILSVTFYLILYPDPPSLLYIGTIISLAYFALFGILATFIFEDEDIDRP